MAGSSQRLPQAARTSLLAGLSPRRRLLAAGLLLLAILAGAAIAAGAAGTRRPAPPPAGRLAQDRPGPVLLVPGYGGQQHALLALAARIRATGRTATVLRLPDAGTGSLIRDADVLDRAVSRALADGARSVDVIGYSAGGVAALLWARGHDGAAEARRVITLGAPFHGTSVAAAAQALVPGACPLACQQLVPGSRLLQRLDAAGPAGLPRWLSLWSTGDKVVTPPDSARLPGAVNVPVQAVCPAARISHSQLPTDPRVVAIILRAIGSGPVRYPTSALCGA